MYVPEGTAEPFEGVIKSADLFSFSKTVASTHLSTGPLLSDFTKYLSPSSTLLAFSPSSKKYVALLAGSSK